MFPASCGPLSCFRRSATTRNIAEAVQHTKKTLNHDHPLNPRQGAYRAAHGQRPMRGAATGGCLCTFKSRSSGWRFLRGADSTHAYVVRLLAGMCSSPNCLIWFPVFLCFARPARRHGAQVFIVPPKTGRYAIIRKFKNGCGRRQRKRTIYSRRHQPLRSGLVGLARITRACYGQWIHFR